MRFHDVTMTEAVSWVDHCIENRQPHSLFGTNVAGFVYSRKNLVLRAFYDSCDLLTIDGMGVYYAGRLLGLPFRETVPGSYLMLKLLSVARDKGYRVFLLGSKPETVRRAAANLNQQFPGVNLVGFHHGYFSKDEETTVVDLINRSQATILFIGMTSPLKEVFVQRNLERIHVPVQMGVGGTIDVLAGEFSLPPPWVRNAGLEWLNRLRQEPRRLWKRYLVTNTAFACILFDHLVHRGLLRTVRKPAQESVSLSIQRSLMMIILPILLLLSPPKA
jgi:N-acetylglucosaminyldiphosphoundecaprenol N-acetyl-beta-D-mannosaminyltransferase